MLAALLVVCFHLGSLFSKLGIPTFGSAGVDLFFVISGFVMVFTTRNRSYTPLVFMARRIARIVPIYWVCTVIVFLLAVGSHSPSALSMKSSEHLIKSLFFVPFLDSNGIFEPILPVGWTLNFEMFFYGLFALALASPRYIVGVVSACVVLVSVSATVLVLKLPLTTPLAFYGDPIILNFVLGMALGLLVLRFPIRRSRKSLASLVAVDCVAVVLVLVGQHESKGRMIHLITVGLPCFGLVGTAFVMEQWGITINSALLLALGNASYSLYLIHIVATRQFVRYATAIQAGPAACSALILTCVLVVSALASITHLYVERPLSRWAQYIFESHSGLRREG